MVSSGLHCVHCERIMTGSILTVYILLTANILLIAGCPHEPEDAKAAYKSGAILDQNTPITLKTIIKKLNDSGVFDANTTLNVREQKELNKLFETVEFMVSSRNRQPSSVQNVFSSLRLVERVVKKQLKEGQLSESLASKFHWDKISTRPIREKPMYHIDRTTNMRVFDIN
ncbi:uncharacterized protein LOC125059168 [Pieris napi]|uniref:uncharacterized protein LOC125059168 n=1 Tax=Pieris napi TaxID=78633 RepID=UPI001FBB7A14|nr:uncharacterized protein LOC125059168 [Pieris napi]